MKSARDTGIVVATLAVALGLAACSKDQTGTATSSSAVTAGSTSTSTSSVTASSTPAPSTPPSSSATATSPPAPANTTDYVGEWTGHTRHMTIAADGTANLSINDGAADGEQWKAQWAPAADGIKLTLTAKVSTIGQGLDGELTQGQVWDAKLEEADDGPMVLYFVQDGTSPSDDAGYYWCSEKFGNSQWCGA